MKTIRISLSFKRLSATLIAVFGQSILTAITNNVYFTNPYPALTILQTAVTNLVNAVAAQHAGDKASTAAVTAAKRELYRVLKMLAAFVEYESNTDEAKALSSGFSLVAVAQASINAFAAVQGLQSGSADVSSPGGGSSYIWQYTTDPIGSAIWLGAATTSQASFTIHGLTPGTKYWFRVALISPAGQQPWSNPAMVHVV
jgi:hypothetical protein